MDKRDLRAPRKNNFKLEYKTVQNVLEELSDTELGEYFKAVCNYELYGDIPEEFSDRTVRALFKVTCRELDHQMDKHERNREVGRQNRSGKAEPKEPAEEIESEEIESEEYTELDKVLTADDILKLEERLPCVSMLIDEVQEQLALNNTLVKNPVRYILTYAENTDWADRVEKDIDSVATGLYGL